MIDLIQHGLVVCALSSFEGTRHPWLFDKLIVEKRADEIRACSSAG